MTKRQELIELFVIRATPAEQPEMRRKLERMTLDELEEAYKFVQVQAAEDELIRINAERAANKALNQYRVHKEREPQRLAEQKALLEADRKTFQVAARNLQSFSLIEANFSLIRSTLGPGFSEYDIQQAIQANAISLSPPTEEEMIEWTRLAIEAHNLKLLNSDLPTLRKLTREAGARGPAPAPPDETQKARAEERNDGFAYPPLPDELLIEGRQELLDSRYLKRCPREVFKFLLKRYGSQQITEALNTRKPGEFWQ
jgi:hypothetical protein